MWNTFQNIGVIFYVSIGINSNNSWMSHIIASDTTTLGAFFTEKFAGNYNSLLRSGTSVGSIDGISILTPDFMSMLCFFYYKIEVPDSTDSRVVEARPKPTERDVWRIRFRLCVIYGYLFWGWMSLCMWIQCLWNLRGSRIKYQVISK